MAEYVCPSGAVVLFDDDVQLPGRLSIGSHGYAQMTRVERNSVVLLHRWLLGLQKGDGRIADHINGNKLDNRRANLRVVTASGSSQNVKGRGSSGRRNVYPCRGRWQARVKVGGKILNLGTFDTPDEAAEAARAARAEHLPYAVDRP